MPTLRHYVDNAPVPTVVTGIGTTDTSVTLSSLVGYPASFPYTATFDLGTSSAEVVLVTAVSGSVATITRNWDGQGAFAHLAGATFAHSAVAQDYTDANSHVVATGGVHGIAGNVVGTSDTQTLTNKTLTAPVVSAPTVTGGSFSAPALTGTATAQQITATATGSGIPLIAKAAAAQPAIETQKSDGTVKFTVDGDTGDVSTPGSVTATGAVTGGSVVTAGNVNAGSYSVGGVAAPFVPTGSVHAYAGATAPSGYLFCDGSAVSRTTYASLFSVIGVFYGVGDGSTTFNVPNLKGSVIVGVDAGQTEFTPLGRTGGAKTHTHPLSSNGQADVLITGSTIHMRAATAASWTETVVGTTSGSSSSGSQTTGAALEGATDAGSTLAPYVALYYIIRT